MKRLMLLLTLAFTFTAQAERLRLAYPAEGTILSAQVGLVFENTDILKKHGFEPEVRAMGTGRELKTALVSNQADVIMTSQTNFVVLLGNGFECYAIHSLGSAGRMALVVAPDSAIKTLEDLKGAKVATIFGTSIHQPALEWLKDAGLEGKTKVIDIGSMAAMQAALKTGAVAAVMTWDPFLAQGLSSKQYRVLKEKEFDLITVSSAGFKKQADSVRRLNEATREALLYVATNKEKVNTWFSKRARLDLETIDTASRFNKNYLAKSLKDITLAIPQRFADEVDKEARFLHQQKMLSRIPNTKPHILN